MYTSLNLKRDGYQVWRFLHHGGEKRIVYIKTKRGLLSTPSSAINEVELAGAMWTK